MTNPKPTKPAMDAAEAIIAAQVKVERVECSLCGEPAEREITFLLENPRTNPASSAYRRDDCSFCQDAHEFACVAHENDVRYNPPDGYTWAGTFQNGERFKHLFTTSRQVNLSPPDIAAIIEEKTGVKELVGEARAMTYAPSDDEEDYPDLQLFRHVMSAVNKLKAALARYETED